MELGTETLIEKVTQQERETREEAEVIRVTDPSTAEGRLKFCRIHIQEVSSRV